MSWSGNRLRLMRFSKWAIVFLSLACLIFMAVTVYGANVGNFVVGIKEADDRGDAKIMLSDRADYSSPTPLLTAKGLPEMADCSKETLGDDYTLIEGIGAKNDTLLRRYMAFSFFLMNVGTEVVDISYVVTLFDDAKAVHRVLRFWIIENNPDSIIFNHNEVYAYERDLNNPEEAAEQAAYEAAIGGAIYKTKNFKDQSNPKNIVVCREKHTTLAPGNVIKYTVAIWLEGYEPRCNNELIGAKLKATMTFTAEIPEE